MRPPPRSPRGRSAGLHHGLLRAGREGSNHICDRRRPRDSKQRGAGGRRPQGSVRGAWTDPARWRHQLELPMPWGMASGWCGEQFKAAFSCFHYSQEDVKGSDCVDQFRAMHECMQKYPDLCPQEEEEEKPADPLQEAAASEASATRGSASS